MKPMTLYVEKSSLIHRIDPITKLIYAIVIAAVPFILPNYYLSAAFIFCSVIVLYFGKVLSKIIPIIWLSMFLIASIIIVQGLVSPRNVTPLLTVGPITFYREGLLFGLLLIMRVINMITAFGVLILTTKPDHLVEALIKMGLSPRIGYIIGSVLQLIPQISATIGTISDAQRSRGLETEGKLLTRIKAFFPLIGPVIMNSLISVRERSIALEVRGFNSNKKKTFINEPIQFKYGKFIQVVLIIMLIIAVVWRIL